MSRDIVRILETGVMSDADGAGCDRGGGAGRPVQERGGPGLWLSRRWVQILVARYLAEGELRSSAGPAARAPAPLRTGRAVEDAIVALRKDLAEAGHDAGRRPSPGTCAGRRAARRWQRRSGGSCPAADSSPRSRTSAPGRPGTSSRADLPNQLWQADITHWPLAGGAIAEILNILDDHSRLLVGSTARPVFKAADIVADLHAATARHGRPERMLTDIQRRAVH